MGEPAEKCRKADLLRYLVAVGDRSSAGNAENHYRSLRAFFRFAVSEGLSQTNPLQGVPRPRLEKKVIREVSVEEMRLLIKTCRASAPCGIRDEAILMLLYDAGLRAGEVAAIRVEDLDLQHGLVIVRGKGAKERRVPIGYKSARAISRHLGQTKQDSNNEAVFLTARGKSFTHRSLGDMIERVCRRAGLRRLHPHLFRHSAAVTFLRNGGGPFHLQRLLGHSDLTMTRRYCSLVDDDVLEAHRQFGPGDRL